MNNIDTYKELIQLRQVFKAVSQLSWEVNQIDKRYPIDKIQDDQLEGLKAIYLTVADKFNQLHSELYETTNN